MNSFFTSIRFASRWFAYGLLLGAVLLAGMVWRARTTEFHRGGFLRFHPLASPESQYRPTVEEMVSIVRNRCRPDQVLVLVGGNSILYGVGQPAAEVWTRRLQELLGARFCVINFAFRGGSITDGAAVVSEVLRDEYPQQILVANAAPIQASDPVGVEAYRYLIEYAYGNGLFTASPERDARLQTLPAVHPDTPAYWFNRLERYLGFRTFWNSVAWNHISTVPFDLMPRFPTWSRARADWPDPEPDTSLVPIEERFLPQFFDKELEVARAFSGEVTEKDPASGQWRVRPPTEQSFRANAARMRPDSLKAKTLVITSGNNPYHTRHFTADEQIRDEFARQASVRLWEEMGYAALAYGPEMSVEDYVDRTHLTKSGGNKLADLVAPEIRALAAQLFAVHD